MSTASYKVCLRGHPELYLIVQARSEAEARLKAKRFFTKEPIHKIEAVEKLDDLQAKQRGPTANDAMKSRWQGLNVGANTQLR